MQLLLKLEDNRLIETVGIPVEDEKGSVRLTACVSSQVFDLLLSFESSMNELLFSFFAVMFVLLIKKLIFSICFCYVLLLFGYLGRLPSEMLFLCHWKRRLF